MVDTLNTPDREWLCTSTQHSNRVEENVAGGKEWIYGIDDDDDGDDDDISSRCKAHTLSNRCEDCNGEK